MGLPSSPVRASVRASFMGRCPTNKFACVEQTKLWWELPDSALLVAAYLGGPSVALNLAAVSKAFNKAVVEAWEDLTQLFPQRLYVVGGLDSAFRPVSSAWRFDTGLCIWEVLPDIASPRAGPAAIAANGYLYVVGGEFCGDAVQDAQRFDPCSGQWETLAPMLEGRIRATAVASGGYIYVFGGLDGLKSLRTAERYDPSTNTWEALPPMHCPRYACASAVQPRGCIVVFGGELTDDGNAASIECFDPAVNAWESLPAVRSTPCGAATSITGSGGMAFAVGGLGLSGQALPVAEKISLGPALAAASDPLIAHFSPPAWSSMPPMLTPRHLASVAGFGAGTVVVGGKGPTFEAVSKVEMYDPEVDMWESLPPLPSPRLRAAVVGGRL